MNEVSPGKGGAPIPVPRSEGNGCAIHVLKSEEITVSCPSCGYTEIEAGPLDCKGFCALCAQARREEDDREGPHHTPMVAMALDGLRRGAERGWE